MNGFDLLLIALLVLGVFCALRSTRRSKKAGGCTGCTQSCKGCTHALK